MAWKRKRGLLGGSRKRRAGKRNGMSKRKNRRRRRRGRNYGKERLKVLGMGAIYGKLRRKDTSGKSMLDAVPVIDSIGATATHAVMAHFGAQWFRNKWLDALATALAGHCGVQFGLTDFNMESFAKLEGDDYDEISGALDV